MGGYKSDEKELNFGSDHIEEQEKFQDAIKQRGTINYKYSIFPIVKIERRTDGKYAFKDIFKVLKDLETALPIGEELFANDMMIRSTLKQTISYPKKWFVSISELKKYYRNLSKTLNNFMYDNNGSNRYIARDYRVIDVDIVITDIGSDKILSAHEIQELFK